MTRCADGEVLIKDLSLRCVQKVFEVSLWRDEALIDLVTNLGHEVSSFICHIHDYTEIV